MPGFVTAGAAAATQAGNTLTVTQATTNATLNWQSFNISSDGKVVFQQPSSSAVALNRIYQSDPSQIFGSLTANGSVYLINRNGILFGQGAQVNVGSLVASSLDLSPDAVTGGIATPITNGNPAFVAFTNPNTGATLPSGPVTVAAGANIQTSEGGQVLMFAPERVTNEGTIQTPGGQTLLAAGSPVYLETSTDSNLRGLLVEVGVGGTVTNGSASNTAGMSPSQLVGQIIADRGNITLAGLAVNQTGRVMATTTINENGSIRLEAREGATATPGSGGSGGSIIPGSGGTLTLGPGSDTEVALDTADSSTTVDSVAQPQSSIALFGQTIDVLDDASVTAHGGSISALAEADQNALQTSAVPDSSRFYLAPSATLDVSGAQVTLPVSSNIVAVQLRGTELADSPVQQGGPLQGQTVYVDARLHGTRADGTTWVGTPLADVSGEVDAIQRTVAERNLDGGSVTIRSQGDVILAPGSTVDVAGGAITYTGGLISTSKLLTAAGTVVDIGSAQPDVLYRGIVQTTSFGDSRWGVTSTASSAISTYQAGYVQGMDAGTVTLATPRFMLDGTLNGTVTRGIYQRQPESSVAADELYHFYDQVPEGGTLLLGDTSQGKSTGNYVLGNVTFGTGEVSTGLLNAGGSAFDPLTDPWPSSDTASVLRPDLLGSGGIAQVSIASNGQVMLPAGLSVSLPGDGGLTINADDIDIEGQIGIPGGAVNLASRTGGLTLGDQASIDVAGVWVNDLPALTRPDTSRAPLDLHGGSVTLTDSGGALLLESGSRIDVSGGAQLGADHKLHAGAGGSVTIQLPQLLPGNAAPPITLATQLLGYGIAQGGSLNLKASAVCIAASDCAGGDAGTLWLNPAWFQSGGFGSYSVSSTVGGLTVEPGTTLDLYQLNYRLPLDYVQQSSTAEGLGVFATPVLLSQFYRAPTNLALSTDVYTGGQLIDDTALRQLPLLTIGTGASIQADPEATLSLTSDTRLVEDGALVAPGGKINLLLQSDLFVLGDLPSQALWLGSGATLDASGVAQIAPSGTGLLTGSVLDGGTVSLAADSGFVELLPGSQIRVTGAVGTLDVTSLGPPGEQGPVTRQQVASAGGTVSLTAAEGMSIEGAFAAQAGPAVAGGRQPAAGSLSVTLDPTLRGDPTDPTVITSLLNTGPRTIVLTQSAPVDGPSEGGGVIASQYGQAFIGADTIMQGGFASVSLQAEDLRATRQSAPVYIPGVIEYSGAVTLAAPQQISMNAAVLAAAEGQGSLLLQAPYLSIGNSGSLLQSSGYQAAVASPGSASLAAQADFIDLYGSLALQGIGSASFHSQGDIRLRAVEQQSDPTSATQSSLEASIAGGLSAQGDLEFSAQQLYPTTLANYAITTDPTSGSITIQGVGGTPDTVLSAGGSLTLTAHTVTQNGTLRAPLGGINIQADSITLGAGSLTSTSAEGMTIPFGSTQGGFDWIYPLDYNGASVVFGADGLPVPSQRIALQGTSVNLQTGASVDVSGGGDLQAYEFVPGVGGTRDVLTGADASKEFAIVPALSLRSAPYDQQFMQGWEWQNGQSIHLSGASGLQAGDYVILPARYALLPGAFLVKAVAGYQDLASGTQIPLTDGGTIVSGYLLNAATGDGSARNAGFEVLPSQDVLKLAQYTLTSADTFFSQQATNAGVEATALPEDSGTLTLTASAELTLDATLQSVPGPGGRGARVDIASAQIAIVPDGAAAAPSGWLQLPASALDNLGAQSLLIGGSRDGQALTVESQAVMVDSGAQLAAPELMLAADDVSVQSGAALSASGVAAPSQAYTIAGDGALLRVSSGPQATVARTAGSGTGNIDLQAGSSLSTAGGSVYIDAPGISQLDGKLSIAGSDLAIDSQVLNLGQVPNGTAGTNLVADSFAGLNLHDLRLIGRTGVDLYGSFSAQVSSLEIDTPALEGFGAAGDTAALSAVGALSLSNDSDATALSTGTGLGTLSLSGASIELGGGSLAMGGFGAVHLDASGAIASTADTTLSVDAPLGLSAASLGPSQASRLTLQSTGSFSYTSSGQAVASDDLGGALTVTAPDILVDGKVAAPSGTVILTSTSSAPGAGLTLGGNAVIDVAGAQRTFDGVTVSAPGGAVSLASAGAMSLQSGSVVNVSAADGGSGGTLTLSAPSGDVTLAGTLSGQGAEAQGSSFSLDAQSFGNFDALTQNLNAGGFLAARSIRLRGPGSITVGADPADAVRASTVQLEADQGSVLVDGTVDASGDAGGSIQLSGAGGVSITGTLDAHATAAGDAGGQIELMTGTGGTLTLQAGSVLNVSGGVGGAGGQVLLRLPRAGLSSGSPLALQLSGTIEGASETTVEAVQTYANATGTISAADTAAVPSNPMYADAAGFLSDAATIIQALGETDNPTFRLAPGIEIDSAGPLSLASDWNLADWNFGGVAGILTIRAGGSLQINASLSDGFTSPTSFLLPPTPTESWSYRLVAGSDLAAVAPLATSAGTPSDFTVAPSVMVRTGTGFIDVAASGNFVLGDQASVLYTAGVAGPGVPLSGRNNGSLQGLAYPVDGGDIRISAGGDIIGAPTNQFVNAWLWRAGRPSTASSSSATGWTVSFANFNQGIGALAGGNVTVSAGGSISDLSVSIPTIGVQTGGTTADSSVVNVTGGGRLSVRAGGAVLGGSFFDGSGSASLRAGTDIGASDPADGGSGLDPLLGLGSGSWSVVAGDNLTLAGIVNPQLLPQGSAQGAGNVTSYFSTYSADSSVALTAVGGTLSLPDETASLTQALTSMNWTATNNDIGLYVMPPTLQAAALNGSLILGGSTDLFPSASGNLNLFAHQDIRANTSGGNAVQVVLSDADSSLLGTVAVPVTTVSPLFTAFPTSILSSAQQHAVDPVHTGDMTPIRIVAQIGDVVFPDNGDASVIYSAKSARIIAGGDLIDVPLEAQNLQPSDVTSLIAGGNITYTQARSALGGIVPSQREVQVDGPGSLQLTAGGSVNLGTSQGLSTTGNLLNPALPAGGAEVSVVAGVGSQPPQYGTFISTYIDSTSTYDEELIAFVETLTGQSGLTADEAKSAFHALSADSQDAFARQVLIDELRAGGRTAAAGSDDFTRAFTALSTLFPGANPNIASGGSNPYAGGIELYFSRIYTLSGGSISLFAPGGEINVGLAQAPASFGISKSASQLGIVAQGVGDVSAVAYNDFQVNQSRVFAADGGDILVWSTDGDIDAGRGAKTAISAPPPVITTDQNGRLQVTFSNVLTGSGIQALATSPDVSPGDVDLFAPHGVVNANDAGIVAGNLTIAATAVLGANNITVSGTSVGVPVAAVGLGASLAGSSAAAAAAASTTQSQLASAQTQQQPAAPLAQSALSWLDVFITGLGPEDCKPDDLQCLQRESGAQ